MTHPNPFNERPEWGDVCMNKEGNVLYLHVLHMPETGHISLEKLPVRVTSVNRLDNGQGIDFEQKGGSFNISCPGRSKDALDMVLKVEIDKPML